jgi:hypothetical protein
MEFLGRGWSEGFAELVRGAGRELLICSPFVARRGAEILATNVSPEFRERGRLLLLTDLSPISACEGSTDPQAIADLVGSLPSSILVHLPRLHAKVYVADACHAIVTSGNLTAGGLIHNYEYGVDVQDNLAVRRISEEIKGFAGLGAILDKERLERYCEVAESARVAYGQRRPKIDAAMGAELRGLLGVAADELVRARLAGGAMHTVFARTILYLLKRDGSLDTPAMHTMVEAIHPDLCDNSVDRVIDGKRFGKKWKHAVRTAQQKLKRDGLVELRAGRWHLRGEQDRDGPRRS